MSSKIDDSVGTVAFQHQRKLEDDSRCVAVKRAPRTRRHHNSSQSTGAGGARFYRDAACIFVMRKCRAKKLHLFFLVWPMACLACYSSFMTSLRLVASSGPDDIMLYDSQHCTAAFHQSPGCHHDGAGIVACLTDRESVAHALALVEGMSSNWDHSSSSPAAPPPNLELYHTGGLLSYYLEAQLEKHSFVTVVDLSSSSSRGVDPLFHEDDGDRFTRCVRDAFRTSQLQDIILVRPSIIFLQNPRDLVRHMVELHLKQRRQEDVSCRQYATATEQGLVETIETLATTTGTSACNVPFMMRSQGPPTPATVRLKASSQSVAEIYHPFWAYPSRDHLVWVRHHLDADKSRFVLVNDDAGSGNVTLLPQAYYDPLMAKWHRYSNATTTLLMDRPVDWVAFDGGFHFESGGPLNSLIAAKKSILLGASHVNIDLTLTEDKKMIASHNDHVFSPFEEGSLFRPISSIGVAEARKLTNLCVPEKAARQWLDNNRYKSFGCLPEKAALVDSFISGLPETTTRFIFDLKAPTDELQVEQAQLVSGIMKNGTRRRPTNSISVRFFDASEDERDLVASIIPEHALSALQNDASIRELPYFVNAPSALACSQITNWIKTTTSRRFLNRNILGCFVVLEHERMQQSWESFVAANNVTLDAPVSRDFDNQIICDVPRKQAQPDSLIWKEGFSHCVSEGYDMVHHPFSFPLKNDLAVPPVAIPRLEENALATITSHLAVLSGNRHHFTSHWGYALSSDWSNRRDWWFEDDRMVSSKRPWRSNTSPYFCLSKVFTVMLFFRLEELNLLHLDDVVVANETTHNATWRYIFTNTAGQDGENEGTRFKYANGLWKYVSAAVQEATGLHFLNAVQHYILDPMGTVGYFNESTSSPPYEARGFVGPLEDLLVMGSTLANRGVSPITRKRVISAQSVEAILSESTIGAIKPTYSRDFIARSMKRYHYHDGVSNSTRGMVDGYAIGLWCVPGWRVDSEGQPIRGWMAMGKDIILYFDMTGLVVAMHSSRMNVSKRQKNTQRSQMIRELTKPFAQTVGGIGDHLLSAMPHL